MISSFCDFRFTFWNIRDLGDEKKCPIVHAVLTSPNLSIACLQETKLCLTDRAKALSFLPTWLSRFECKYTAGSSGGVLMDLGPRLFLA
jgi:hypothetical protein